MTVWMVAYRWFNMPGTPAHIRYPGHGITRIPPSQHARLDRDRALATARHLNLEDQHSSSFCRTYWFVLKMEVK
jgi:hypothetical protein